MILVLRTVLFFFVVSAVACTAAGKELIRIHRSEKGPAAGVCPLVPSCSEYALQSMNQIPFLGFLLTVDRLLYLERDSDLKLLELPGTSGRRLFYDPLEDTLPEEGFFSGPVRPSLIRESRN